MPSKAIRSTLTPAALLVGRAEAARLCEVSPASWDRLTAAGKTPASLRLGGRVLWTRHDLESWTSLGCPDRKTYETLTRCDGGAAC